MTDSHIPSYDQVATINKSLENIKRLEGQISDAQQRYEQIKKDISLRLQGDYRRIEYDIKKVKDSFKTNQELAVFRQGELELYKKFEHHILASVRNFMSSQEYISFLQSFFENHRESVTKIIIDPQLSNYFDRNITTTKPKSALFQTVDFDYDFGEAAIINVVGKSLLSNN